MSTPAGARLLWLAEPVLMLATQLRATSWMADIGRLHDKIVVILSDFQAGARAGGIDPARVAAAAEVLAALIDQVVASVPWGADAGWRSVNKSAATAHLSPAQRLLEIAAASYADAGMNELLGVAVSLGFDKRSRGADHAQIEALFERLTAPTRAPVSATLSADRAGTLPRKHLVTRWLPLWVSSLVVAAVLAALFVGLQLSLRARSDRLYARVAALRGPVTATRARPAGEPRLAATLPPTFAARGVGLREGTDRSVLTVPDALLFQNGEPTLTSAAAEVLQPIAAALQISPGKIRIIGHSDGTLARSARYLSDWDLSVDRAQAVRDALHDLGIDAARLAYDGRGSVEPALSDNGAIDPGGAGRVEIILLAGR